MLKSQKIKHLDGLFVNSIDSSKSGIVQCKLIVDIPAPYSTTTTRDDVVRKYLMFSGSYRAVILGFYAETNITTHANRVLYQCPKTGSMTAAMYYRYSDWNGTTKIYESDAILYPNKIEFVTKNQEATEILLVLV